MSDDFWSDLRSAPVGPGTHTDTRPREKKRDDTDAERHTKARVSAPAPSIESATAYAAPPVSTWGAIVREPDPFLAQHGTPPEMRDNTRAEEEELRKREEKVIPPKPTEPPKAPVSDEAHEPADTPKTESTGGVSTEDEEEASWRERLANAREKASEGAAPVKKVVSTAYRAVSPQRGQSFSFLWACGASIAVSPQTLLAAWDRVIAIFGAPQWRSGPEPMAWGLFEGPGVWFRTVLEAHWASGTQGRLVLLALVGILPILVAQFAEKISQPTVRKWLMLLGYGFPVFFICAVSYIPFLGFHTWNEVYVTALFTAAWWGFSVSRTYPPGFVQFLLRIPLASVIVGIVAYSPGAAF